MSLKIISFPKSNKTFISYFVIGALTQLLDYISYAVLVKFGLFYLIADFVNNPLVLGFNYLVHKKFSFRDKSPHAKTLSRYGLNLIVNYVYTTAVLILLVEVVRVEMIWAKLLQILITGIINYQMLKRFVFNNVQGER